jgi:hypothetical protein
MLVHGTRASPSAAVKDNVAIHVIRLPADTLPVARVGGNETNRPGLETFSNNFFRGW